MSTETHSNDPDVLIIGGGPAGTTLGSFLAKSGRSVVVLEKDRHPRFHIGESLLPMNLPILDSLGVLGEIEKIGVHKLGADFTSGDDPDDYHTYRFDRALGKSPGFAFEVKRDQFDHVLLENCRRSGATVLEEHQVTDVNFQENGFHVLTSLDANGQQYHWQPRLVVDASGRDAFVARRKKWKEKNPRHASAAIFGHFSGVKRRPGKDQGNISIYWFAHGWMWMIPLQNDVMSVGAVCWPEYLKQRRLNPEDFLIDTLRLCPAANARVDGARLISPVRVTGNYSYRSEKVWSDGFFMIGDAYAFVDPVFSSGVYLAMSSAESAVTMANHWLDGDNKAFRKAARRYKRRVNTGIRNFSWFIYRFTSPAMRSLFNDPRNICKVEQAVVSMLAGDVFENSEVKVRLILFRFIYTISWLVNFRQSLSARARRISNARLEFQGSTTDST